MNNTSVHYGPDGEGRARDYSSRSESRNHEKSLAEIVAEIRDELKDFVTTRVRMARAEIQQGLSAVKVGLPLIAMAVGFMLVAFLLFTAACVTLVASAFAGNPYAWFYGFIIIGCLWVIFAAVCGFFAYNQFKGAFPKRTIQVIKADKVWLQTEARSHS